MYRILGTIWVVVIFLLVGCHGDGGNGADDDRDTETSTLSEDTGEPGTDSQTDEPGTDSQTDVDHQLEGVTELLLIDDFDDGDEINELGGTWFTYDDSHEGGTSEVWPASVMLGGYIETSSPGYGDEGAAARIFGTTGDVFSWDYVGMETSLHPDGLCPLAHPIDEDLSTYDGIQFMAKATYSTWGTLTVHLPYTKSGEESNCTQNGVTGDSLSAYADYFADFRGQVTDEWSLVRVPFSDFAQPDWGHRFLFNDVIAQLQNIKWEFKTSNGEVDLWVDDVAFYKAEADPNDVYPRAVLDTSVEPALAVDAVPAEIVTATEPPVDGQSFTVSNRVEILEEPQMLWDAALYALNDTPMKREDVIHTVFYARCVSPPEGKANCNTRFIFQKAESPYTKSVEFPVMVGSEWTRFSVPFYVSQAYDSAEAIALFFLGYAPQTIEIGGFSMTNYGNTQTLDSFNLSSYGYVGRPADAAWRAAAAERIETYRKGDVSIVVTNGDGAPISNATVAVSQTAHHFGFGTAVNVGDLMGNLGEADLAQYETGISSLFNTVVLENSLKWPLLDGTIGENIGVPNAQWGVDWAAERNLNARGHVLVWPGWGNLPARLQREYDEQVTQNGEAVAAEWLESEIESHIATTVTTFAGGLFQWDVINEPFDNHDLMDILGNEVMADWLQTARDADPDARLFINDYSILAKKITNSASRENLYNIAESLIAAGAPLDGIGFQAHFDAELTPPADIYNMLEQFAGLGTELWVTEYDLPNIDAELAADYTRDFMTILFSHPAAGGFMMWGFWDGNHYSGSAPIYDLQWQEKPSGQAYRNLVFNEWHTDETGTTAADGTYTTRAFYGEYEITVTAGDVTTTQTVSFTPETSAIVEINL